MYGCILVVGGGMNFCGIGTWLQNRISLQIPYMYRAGEFCIKNYICFVFCELKLIHNFQNSAIDLNFIPT